MEPDDEINHLIKQTKERIEVSRRMLEHLREKQEATAREIAEHRANLARLRARLGELEAFNNRWRVKG